MTLEPESVTNKSDLAVANVLECWLSGDNRFHPVIRHDNPSAAASSGSDRMDGDIQGMHLRVIACGTGRLSRCV